MMRRVRMGVLVTLGLSACSSVSAQRSIKPIDETIVIHRGDEETFDLALVAPHARVRVAGGSCGDLEVRAKYETEGVEPIVEHRAHANAHAEIEVREVVRAAQTEHYGAWTVCVGGAAPEVLRVDARGGRFDISTFAVNNVEIVAGEGHVELELLGVQRSVGIVVRATESTTVGVKLPQHAGIRISANAAQKVELDALDHLGAGSYVNASWSEGDEPRVDVTIEGPAKVRAREQNWRGRWR